METDLPKQEKPKNFTGFIIIQSITLARIPLAVCFAIILLTGKDSQLKLALSLIILLLIEGTDAFDGIIARRLGLASEYGATLDPFADSISRLIVYSSMAAHNLVLLLVPLCMAVRDITVAYARIILAKKKLTVSARRSGKIKAVFQAIGAFLALFGPYYWEYTGNWSFYLLSWIIIVITLLSSIEYVNAAIQALRKS